MSIIIARQLVPADFIIFDTFTNFAVDIPKTKTKHGVIPGPEITDHVQIGDATVTFRGVMGLTLVTPSLTPTRIRLFFDTIGSALCVLTTPFGVFSNVIVQGKEVDTRIGASMEIDVRAEQIRIPSILEVPIPPRTPNPAAAAQQSSPQDLGTASGAGAATQSTSLAAASADLADGLLGVFF